MIRELLFNCSESSFNAIAIAESVWHWFNENLWTFIQIQPIMSHNAVYVANNNNNSATRRPQRPRKKTQFCFNNDVVVSLLFIVSISIVNVLRFKWMLLKITHQSITIGWAFKIVRPFNRFYRNRMPFMSFPEINFKYDKNQKKNTESIIHFFTFLFHSKHLHTCIWPPPRVWVCLISMAFSFLFFNISLLFLLLIVFSFFPLSSWRKWNSND